MDFSGKRVLVFGTGISGIAAAKLLQMKQANVVLFDGNRDLDRERIMEDLGNTERTELFLGELPDEVKKSLDLVILSPGIPTDLPLVNELRDAHLPIWGEVELAYRCGRGDVLAVTGTNGKTTTTSLLGEIMKRYSDSVKVVGNIGIPYTQVADETKEDTVIAAEISSFQLETIDTFAPHVSAILNITPDHLDRHHTMENYIAAKESITKNQRQGDVCVLNYEDEVLREFGETLPFKVVYFSSARKLRKVYTCREKRLCGGGMEKRTFTSLWTSSRSSENTIMRMPWRLSPSGTPWAYRRMPSSVDFAPFRRWSIE